MTSAGNLTADLELKAGQFVSELKRTNNRLEKFEKRFERTSRKGTQAMRTLGRAARSGFAALVGGSVAIALKNTTELAENLQLVSTRLGVSARELQAWQLIAERSGVSANQLTLGVQRLTRRAAEAAKGMGEARGALRTLGIDAGRFANLSLDAKMLQLARAFRSVGSDSEQLQLAFKLFDSEGTAVLQFLKDGEEGLQRLRDELDGQLWSDAEIEKLAEANRQFTELGQKIRLLTGDLAAAAIGVTDFFLSLSDKLTNYVRNIQAAGGNAVAAAKLLRSQGLDPNGRASSILGPITIDRGTGGNTRPGPYGPFQGAPSISPTVTATAAASTTKASDVMTTQLDAMVEAFSDRLDVMDQRRETFTTLFTDNLVQAADSGFASILESWARTLQQMAARALASQVFNLLGFGNPDGGFLGIGKLFGGARAAGGPVAGGRAYLVGERGPELFVPPGGGGQVVANGGFGGSSYNFTIDARGASPGTEQRIREAVTQAVAMAEQRRIEGRKRGR